MERGLLSTSRLPGEEYSCLGGGGMGISFWDEVLYLAVRPVMFPVMFFKWSKVGPSGGGQPARP